MRGQEDTRTGTTASLIAEVASGFGRLVQGELRLVRAEATEGMKAAKGGLVRLILAAIFGLVGLNVLAETGVAALSAAGLGPVWAGLVIVAALCLAALGLALSGRAALRLRALWPDRTMRGLRRNAEVLGAGLKRKGDRHV